MESKTKPKCECEFEPEFPGLQYFAEGWFCMRCGKPEDKARVEKWKEGQRTNMAKDMTNTRRKTFATPLEFWQWAIMEPGKRKARSEKRRRTFYVGQSSPECCPWTYSHRDGYQPGVEHMGADSCPLIAVEDEHGAIEEEKPIRDAGEEIMEILSPLGRVAAARSLAAYRALIREEIAAATVEMDVGRTGRWEEQDDLRLKPQGDK